MMYPEIQRAAEQGDAEAQFRLGEMYNMALGVPHDGVKASELYLKAARKGHGGAQFELGMMYYYGAEGFRTNLSKAADWLRKSISQGHIYAVDYLKEVEWEMNREFREQMADAASKYRIWGWITSREQRSKVMRLLNAVLGGCITKVAKTIRRTLQKQSSGIRRRQTKG
jgi:hypothetical protein